MKKHILLLLIITEAAIFLTACKKSAFDENYYNPEKTTNGTIDGLYSGLFKNRRVFPNYWNLYTFVSTMMGTYTQSVGFLNTNRMYEQAVNYTQDRWNDFYTSPGDNWTGPVASYREIEKLYNALPTAEEKSGYLLFLETARIFLYDQATQQVDLWGDIPFSRAGLLNATGSLTLAEYDRGEAVYDSALINLQRISNYLAAVQPDQFYLNKLAKQDFLLKGDLTAWRRYCNSLLLRLAMRISYKDEARAKSLVQEILGNPGQYPLIEQVSQNVQITAGAPSLLTTDMASGWGDANLAPGYMLDSLMLPSADPRLRVFFNRNKNGEYKGLPLRWDGGTQQTAVGNNLISRLDSVTFIRNEYFPGIILTAAEVSFCKAEAFERWGLGDAKMAYETGIRQSIAYYYQIHNLSQYGTHEAAPTEAEVLLMLANPLVAYGLQGRDDNLNKIGLQKWVDFGWMLSPQSWAEMRRSGYPRLFFPTDVSTTTMPTPPTRLLYPEKERTLNTEHYNTVADQDRAYNKVFWDVN